jgi:hypothetical protein
LRARKYESSKNENAIDIFISSHALMLSYCFLPHLNDFLFPTIPKERALEVRKKSGLRGPKAHIDKHKGNESDREMEEKRKKPKPPKKKKKILFG